MTTYAPAFAITPRNASAAISTANTNRDGTGTVGTIFTAGSGGSRVEKISIVPAGTTTAGMVRIFVYNGSAYFLLKEVPIQAVTPSGTAPVQPVVLVSGQDIELPIILPSTHSIRVSTHNAETFHITIEGGDF